MIHTLIGEQWLLDQFAEQAGGLSDSPEDLLIAIEDALESGELTIDEVHEMLADYNRRSP